MLGSIFLFLAFISHFFSGKVDQSLVENGPLGAPGTETPDNWFGSIGAFFANIFISKGFGAMALIIPVFNLLLGLAIFENQYYRFVFQIFRRVVPIILWGSTFLAFLVLVFGGTWYDAGGGFGLYLNSIMFNFVGKPGMFILILLTAFVILIAQWRIPFSLPTLLSMFGNPTLKKAAESLGLEEEGNEIITTDNQQESNGQQELTGEFTVPDNLRKEHEDGEDDPEQEGSLLEFKVRKAEEKPVQEDLIKVDNERFKLKIETGSEPVLEVVDTVGREQQPEIILENDTEPLQHNLVISEDKVEKYVPDSDKETLDDDEIVADFEQYDPTRELSAYQFPTIDLLRNYENHGKREINQAELQENAQRIKNTLKDFGIGVKVEKAVIGPTVTLYEIIPDAGTKISRIKGLEDDIALRLAANGIRIIAPMPGRGTIGIEIPNSNPEIVSFRSVIASEKFRDTTMELPIALGRTISNEVFVADLTKMPHLLVAGATGQGKSVGLNTIIASILYKKHPAFVKFVLIDPKKVEMSLFNGLMNHFLAKLPNLEDAIITDVKQVISVLNSLCVEMDSRYLLLKEAGCKNLREYNEKFLNRKLNPKKGHRFMPYIVLVIDELADLMITAGKEVEMPIARLAQLARAIGIHLVVATQRPSVNVITGIIKANFPARMAFRVTSKIDSRTILDGNGADQLIGRGDMLLSVGNDLIRIQNAFIDTPEIESLVDFIGHQKSYGHPYLLPEVSTGEEGEEENDLSADETDSMFADAARLVVMHQKGSTSLIQRKLKLGYNRAGRIMDQLELAGIVGPSQGSKERDVKVFSMDQLEQILREMGV